MRRYLPPVVAAVVLTATLQAAPPAAAEQPSGATSVRTWNRVAVETLVSFPPPDAIPPPVHAVYLAYVHRAVYDAVDHLPPPASFTAAVTGAAHGVLSHYFPSRQTTLDAAYDLSLQDSDGPAEALGLAFGERAARKLIKERTDDGLNGAPAVIPPYQPGVWTSQSETPAAASWLGRVEPFVLRSPSELRPGPPPALTSARYATGYNEVRTYGERNSTARSGDQTATALLWGEAPAVQSQRALRGHSAGLDSLATARLFALANTASADSLIACADAKFAYNFWRPFSAIPAGETDGNPATEEQNPWFSLVPTPNFPEYPSNHSCTTTAIARVVDALDGTRPFSFTVTRGPDEENPIDSETFTSADQMIQNVADGRVWGGLHYRFSTDAGTQIGNAVAAKVLRAEG
jgi:PAP2 superfamily